MNSSLYIPDVKMLQPRVFTAAAVNSLNNANYDNALTDAVKFAEFNFVG